VAPLLALIYAAGSVVCHQLPERSFHLGVYQFPVCARCLGIYAGLFLIAGVAFFAIGVRPQLPVWGQTPSTRRLLVVVGAMPTVVTVLLEWVGVWQTSNAARFVAGLPLGAAVAAVVMATLHYDRCARRPPIGSPRPPSPI
jgi:uncharacterized membrane protein